VRVAMVVGRCAAGRSPVAGVGCIRDPSAGWEFVPTDVDP
jgi:hypothetical protein